MKNTTAIVILLLAAIIAIIGLAMITLPGQEEIGVYILGGAGVVACISLFPRRKTRRN